MMSYLDDEEFKETIDLAYDELKRLDHLIFVSLKYTRTADMLKQVMKRMISFYEFVIKEPVEPDPNKNVNLTEEDLYGPEEDGPSFQGGY